MKMTRYLAFRLFFIILVVMILGTMLMATFAIDALKHAQMENMLASARQLSDVMQYSLHHSMMLNRRDEIGQIVAKIGSEPGITSVRIYNPDGVASFSSTSQDVGLAIGIDSMACRACHAEGTTPESLDREKLTSVFTTPEGGSVLSMITHINNEPGCSTADCHAHPISAGVLGVLDVTMSLESYDELITQTNHILAVSTGILILVVTFLSGLFIWRMVNVPVRRLTVGTEEIIKGNLSHRIVVRTQDEIGTLADSFNRMTDQLERARKEITEWTATLEQKVEQKTEELRRAQANLIHVEKMASLGKLAATVAHELNNPLEGVLTYAKLLRKRIQGTGLTPEQRSEVDSELALIADETARCGSIVKSLLLFSRQKVGKFQVEDLRSIVDRSIKLIDHHLTLHEIRLDLQLGSQPVPVECDPQQIEQALLALEINAVEAMPAGGSLRVLLEPNTLSGLVTMNISDTGTGIRKEDLPRIFEPFFTTKEEGKGTGLGLSVVYGIIERHNGTVTVASEPGQGTVFTITLPCQTALQEHPGDSAS